MRKTFLNKYNKYSATTKETDVCLWESIGRRNGEGSFGKKYKEMIARIVDEKERSVEVSGMELYWVADFVFVFFLCRALKVRLHMSSSASTSSDNTCSGSH